MFRWGSTHNLVLRAQIVALGLITLFSLSGCLQNGSSAPGSSGASSASSSASGGGLSGGRLPTASSFTAISLVNAFRSNMDPSSLIDLVGTGSEIGSYCTTTNDCQCRLSWVEGGSSYQQDIAPVYVEADLMRCPYTAASGSTQFRISIFITAGALSSNALTVTNNYQNPVTDRSLNTNYQKVVRYQCRDIVQRNTDFYGGSLLDPQVWNLSYTFNLFTTSLGKDYGYTSAGYECPLMPTNMLPAPYTTSDGIYDMKVYSVSPLNGDSTIYPANDSASEDTLNNRHDFYLANFYDGTFRQPFCVPHTITAGQNNLSGGTLDCAYDPTTTPVRVGRDVIGYAAVPDSNEQCPGAGITIPSGKKWAKVWQLRASLPVRSVINVSNPNDIGDLFCTSTSHEWTGSTPSGSNGVDRYAQGAINTYNLGAISMPSVGGIAFGNCSGSSCSATDGSAKFHMRSGYGNATGATCSATTRDQFCTSPNVEFSAAYPSSTTIGAPGIRRVGGLSGGNGSLFSSSTVDGFISTPSTALRGRGGSVCNPTFPGDFWNEGFGGQDVWLIGNGSWGGCIEADTDPDGNLFNDKSNGFLSNSAGASFSNPIKHWFDFLGVTCPGSGDCSTRPSLPLSVASHSPVTSWGGYGIFQFATRAIDTSSSADVMYVVTPAQVTRSQMNDPSNPTFQQYQPYRNLNGAPVYYFIDSGSQNTNDPVQRLPVFPLCVLQDSA